MITSGSFSFWPTRRTTGGTCGECGVADVTTSEVVAHVNGELSYVTMSGCGACGSAEPPRR